MLCAGRKGEFCAYPLRIMAYHGVVNDHLGGLILVVYDVDSSVGAMYDRQVDGKEVFFDDAGMLGGVRTMRDRGTSSTWSMLSGEALDGPMHGKKLMRLPSVQITWGRWRSLHPDSYIIKEDAKQAAHYVIRNTPATCPLPASERAKIVEAANKKLKGDSLVLGLIGESSQVAFPLDSLDSSKPALAAMLDAKPIVVFTDARAKAHAAYWPVADGKTLKFSGQSLNGAMSFLDAQTGSVWTLEGACIDGPMKGKSLEAVPGSVCRWYAWALTYPSTDVARPRRVAVRPPFFAVRL